jgi:large subunit ribosomal protein L29
MAEKQHPAEAARELNDGEIAKALEDAQRELFNLRMRHATRQLENQQAVGRVRRQIARLKTIQTERRLGLKRG